MYQFWKEYGNELMFVTGAPLSNLGTFIEKYSHEMNEQNRIGLCVIQGGFAGDNVVPSQFRLSKFAGKTKLSTYNFGGNIKAAKTVLNCPFIDKRLLVSKNVCHGVVYGQDRHMQLKERLSQLELSRASFSSQQHLSFIGLNLTFKGMQKYLEKNTDGKKFHDVLAGCVSVEPNICIFKRVEITEEKNQWGSQESINSNTFISVAVNLKEFFDVMMMKEYL
ncbi:hypothetical protein FDP41_002033 [Naegleria fowleri]|uniref:Inosine/uridine-preferring nucleoside hydrolase domain-containing protein n=1 Tax=Naegleria fowleri TaxID=5763 RepID=A0A6A5BLR6_NAEFO|nr:uncharacterized protein FDP41_002033 [Naegleria fowleri]KAF0978963.1 hypothetical protein FDP41_002033 [Naegleria fowleri]CAG4709710.1 unnamed protein product [Naegleria fowleri]